MIRIDRDWIWGVVTLLALFVSCAIMLFLLTRCAGADPTAAVYGAERLRCVTEHDAATTARECMRAVDQKYHQDGGLK